MPSPEEVAMLEGFRAAKEVWAALQEGASRVPAALRALLNRRVAGWNGCEF
jgi:hypothetical protein